jgi:hypothetical protein
MDRAREALIKIAKQSAATWQSVRAESFPGDTVVETANTLYRFKDGVFSGRARKPAPGELTAWESPRSMSGVELIGFLAYEGGLWSLSPRWRPGALAVITTNEKAFTLTSPTLACTIQSPPPEPPATRSVFNVPPTVRRPAPPSMTRLQPAPMR